MKKVFEPAGLPDRNNAIEAPPTPVHLPASGLSPTAPMPAMVMSGGPGGSLLLFQMNSVFEPDGVSGRNKPGVSVPLPSQSAISRMSPFTPRELITRSPTPRLLMARRYRVFELAGVFGRRTPIFRIPSLFQSATAGLSPVLPKPAMVLAGGANVFLFRRK